MERNNNRIYDLEERLIDYACKIIDIVEKIPNTRSGNYIAGQLIRSGQSPAFNYGEAQGAESRKDFIHKLSVVLKELKESRTALKIIIKKKMLVDEKEVQSLYIETEELIAIIGKSISTAKKNNSV